MFDLIAGGEKHLPSHATLPIVTSTAVQIIVVGLLVMVPMLFATDRLPEVPTMMAFVAAPPAPPPPPPPPAPAVARKPKPTPRADTPVDRAQFLAPIEEPSEITPLPSDEGEIGVPGGVEGGIPGGVVGGVVGGLPEPPPPPPAPAPAPRVPVRVGGQITQPKLVKRVEPEYPALAIKAHIQGVVILEATVNEEGDVTEVRLLRSANPLLDKEAIAAVRQWRYSPIVLNGTRVPFILSVSLAFSLEASK